MRFWPLRKRKDSLKLAGLEQVMAAAGSDEFEEALEGLTSIIRKNADDLLAQLQALKEAYRKRAPSGPAFPHTFRFSPPVPRDTGPFRSMVSKILDELKAKKGMDYRIVEGKPGEVVAVEHNAATEADRKAVENYGRWVQRICEPPPTSS